MSGVLNISGSTARAVNQFKQTFVSTSLRMVFSFLDKVSYTAFDYHCRFLECSSG